ncbi:spore coat associated protein CotJA [Paenibacillus alvei]|uniref:Spore coat associated protein CotJA n=3 Tax=Paenibacillus TaxID=44249 RepID=A0ABT4GS01_PAEAL|nr:spore coat associated protein CotJA [Paenibacillus alvei]MCY9539792.1 spore coat associated protein CotJA [Paenibacillus alvei]MCY9703313.1 spore coat associated protein CotJA [Paenibacillus alvei]MCY9735465.1 spore coat associated protein CotJA [Paenibacillus alvei]MCY9753053.1 spore coat associated protein CotJA [Paenibacillus alvei]MCY9759358.1 spore coat associated protein CotJA [Paenibacillus alvei]
MRSQIRRYFPHISPHDPCMPVRVKTYVLPPSVLIPFQPSGLPMFPLSRAMRLGTLWRDLYSPYHRRSI